MSKSFPKEEDVKKEVKKLLTQHNWYWWMPPANQFGKSGASDFLAIRPGILMAIETKYKYNKPTEGQKTFLREIDKNDFFAFVVYETTTEVLGSWLAAFDRVIFRTMRNQPPDPGDDQLLRTTNTILTQAYRQ